MKKLTSLKVGKRYVVYDPGADTTLEVEILDRKMHTHYGEHADGKGYRVTMEFSKDITLKRFEVWHYPCVVICEV